VSSAHVVPQRFGRGRRLAGTGWTKTEFKVLQLGVALGAVALVVGWWGASRTTCWSDQMFWVAVSAVALMVLGVVAAEWTLRGMRSVHERSRMVARRVERMERAYPGSVSALGLQGLVTDPGRLVSASGMSRFHLASCQLVAGKQVSGIPVQSTPTSGLDPCGICEPEGVTS
jgi:hypothetical protein